MSVSAVGLRRNEEFDVPPEDVIFGTTKRMAAVRRQVENAAGADLPVFIGGPSGTGKEVIAKLIHSRSPWRTGTFVKVSCPAIPETLLESELFGYERGAFTGAYASKPGRVETAEGGTLFLDEIGELGPGMQAKLLQLLQDGRFCRIGAQRDRRVTVRVLCATNRRLAMEVQRGAFRADLFYRINVLSISLPTLAERREDIPLLIDYLVKKYSTQYAKARPAISKRMLQRLTVQPWPGNIRQLENLVKRFVIVGSEESLTEDDATWGIEGNPPSSVDPKRTAVERAADLQTGLKETLRQLEREVILRALNAHSWNRRLAARALRISYTTLLYKMRVAGIPSTRWSSSDESSTKVQLSEARNQ